MNIHIANIELLFVLYGSLPEGILSKNRPSRPFILARESLGFSECIRYNHVLYHYYDPKHPSLPKMFLNVLKCLKTVLIFHLC